MYTKNYKIKSSTPTLFFGIREFPFSFAHLYTQTTAQQSPCLVSFIRDCSFVLDIFEKERYNALSSRGIYIMVHIFPPCYSSSNTLHSGLCTCILGTNNKMYNQISMPYLTDTTSYQQGTLGLQSRGSFSLFRRLPSELKLEIVKQYLRISSRSYQNPGTLPIQLLEQCFHNLPAFTQRWRWNTIPGRHTRHHSMVLSLGESYLARTSRFLAALPKRSSWF